MVQTRTPREAAIAWVLAQVPVERRGGKTDPREILDHVITQQRLAINKIEKERAGAKSAHTPEQS